VVRKAGGMRPFGRNRRRGKDYIKTDLKEIVCESEEWICKLF
jgi:hypothetical protein